MTRRLLVSHLSLVLMALLALELPLGYVYARGELNRFSAAVDRDSVILAELAEEIIDARKTDMLPALAADYAVRSGGRVVIVDAKGTVLADSGAAAGLGRNLAQEPDIAAALRDRSDTGTRRDAATGAEQFYATMPAWSGTAVRGAVRLSHPTGVLRGHIHEVWLALAIGGACILAATALTALALTRWITRPLHALERAAAQFADGHFTQPPVTDDGPPELRRLAATFTRTATRLHHLLHTQKSFASEASHQLKTPLTALRLRLENFEPYLDPRAHDSLDEAIGEVERLSRMIHGLLALARLENSATTPELVELDAVIADRAATWAPFAAEQQVCIAVVGHPVGPVVAISGALEQIIDNLLANALRVAPPGTSLTLARLRTEGGIELHVIDQGPGMTATERERAFDRFWRAPGTHSDGSGLGLPIVRGLARAGGGDVTLHEAPGGGVDAVVRLQPAATARGRFHTPRPRTVPRFPPSPVRPPEAAVNIAEARVPGGSDVWM
ncbi:sensor histidine kinase [Streptomyces shenzhenensis]|uniref:sensor histidine kinase n=1 Tax=Streptomyces shenzhenensis TaxID=943815 RepID=UPI001F1575C3|nr:ATP-binding protein [Streptomyces shenzhenensis]